MWYMPGIIKDLIPKGLFSKWCVWSQTTLNLGLRGERGRRGELCFLLGAYISSLLPAEAVVPEWLGQGQGQGLTKKHIPDK